MRPPTSSTLFPYTTLFRSGSIIVAVANPRLWRRFCDAVERPELYDDPRFTSNSDRVANRHILKQELETIFAHHTVDELTARLQAQNIPCGRVRSLREALEHPQIAARGT